MSDNPNLNREEKAVDALITGALHAWAPKEASEAEINEFLSSKAVLNDAENVALKRVHERFRSGHDSVEAEDGFVEQQAMESTYMAMNRENVKDDMPAAAREEIERKRASLLAQLKAKKQSTG